MNTPSRAPRPPNSQAHPGACAGPGGQAGFQATTAGPCFTCEHQGGPFGLGIWCVRPGGHQVCALPQRGCAFWSCAPIALKTRP